MKPREEVVSFVFDIHVQYSEVGAVFKEKSLSNQ